MVSTPKQVLRLVRFNMEELEHDVTALEKIYLEKFQREEITNYVWKENSALLKQEFSCLHALVQDLDNLEIPSGLDPREVLHWVTEALRNLITQRQYPGGVQFMVDRTMQKIDKFISQ